MLKQVPNILTVGRFILSIIFLVMLLYSPQVQPSHYSRFIDAAFVFFILTSLTDMVDGPIARKLGVTSKFGRMMDPLADKVLVCGSFICFAIIGQPKLFGCSESTLLIIQWFVVFILIAREAYVTILRHIAESKGVNFAATGSGKIKMFLQAFAIGTVLVKMGHVQTAAWGYWFTTVTYIIMLTSTIVSGVRATQRSSWKQATARL